MEYHYVYRITDIKKEKYYVGCRTSTIKPEEDLGYIYFSSSGNPQFIKSQKKDPNRFIYEIIETFPSRDEAEQYEKELLSDIDARSNESFYNGVNSLG